MARNDCPSDEIASSILTGSASRRTWASSRSSVVTICSKGVVTATLALLVGAWDVHRSSYAQQAPEHGPRFHCAVLVDAKGLRQDVERVQLQLQYLVELEAKMQARLGKAEAQKRITDLQAQVDASERDPGDCVGGKPLANMPDISRATESECKALQEMRVCLGSTSNRNRLWIKLLEADLSR